jgi:hypothetical protein
MGQRQLMLENNEKNNKQILYLLDLKIYTVLLIAIYVIST